MKSLESLYLEKDFKSAKEYILKHRDQFDLGQFHYNLGTLHTKKEEFAVGRFHLEKALQEGYVNTKSLHNLEVVKEILKVDDAGNSAVLWDRILAGSKEIPVSAYLGMTIILLLILGLVVRLKLVIGKWVIIPLVLLTLAPLGFNYFYVSDISVVICLEDIQLREGPSKIYSESSTVDAGTKLITGESSGEWIFIKAPLHHAGWAHRDTLGFL